MKKGIVFLYLSVATMLVAMIICLTDLLLPHDHDANSSEITMNYFDEMSFENIQKKNENKEVYFAYFGFDDCSGCKEFTPLLIAASKDIDYPRIFHIDTSNKSNKKVITEFGIEVVPTLLLFKDGKINKRLVFSGETEEKIKKFLVEIE
jgi:thiol-disulfide isomerase/thioredoxin